MRTFFSVVFVRFKTKEINMLLSRRARAAWFGYRCDGFNGNLISSKMTL